MAQAQDLRQAITSVADRQGPVPVREVTQMRHRNRLLAVATALAMTATVAGAAAASAADGGHKGTSATSTEQPKGKAGSKADGKGDGKAEGKGDNKGDDKGDDKGHGKGASKLDDVAKRYGVSPDRLERALRLVKPLIGKAKGHVDNPAAVALCAKELGLSTARAKQLLAEVFAQYDTPRKPGPVGKDKDRDRGKDRGGDNRDDKGGTEAEFRTVFNAKALSAELGVSVAQARIAVDELAALASAGDGGIVPSGSAFKAIAKKLGVTPDQLNSALRHLKQSAPDKRLAR